MHPYMFICLSEVKSQWEQDKDDIPGISLPSNTSQSTSRTVKVGNPSNKLWESSQLTALSNPPRGGVQEASSPSPPSTVSLRLCGGNSSTLKVFLGAYRPSRRLNPLQS